jgi:hypothetical protein
MNLNSEIRRVELYVEADFVIVSLQLAVWGGYNGLDLPLVTSRVNFKYPKSILSQILTRDTSGTNVQSV